MSNITRAGRFTFDDATGALLVSSSGGGATSDVNITKIGGSAPALNNSLPVELSDGTNAFGTAGNPLSVNVLALSGTVTVTGPLTDTQLRATPVPVSGTVTTTGPLTDTQLRASAVPVTGTITAVTTVTTVTAVTSITNQVDTNLKQVGGANTATAASGVQKVGIVGNAGAAVDSATAATVPANAIYKGVRAATAYPTAVTDGQMVGAMGDKAGRQAVVLNSPRDLIGTVALSSASGSATSFIAAGASGVFNDIISLIITNETATATIVSLSDNGAAGNVYKFAIAANGGIVINFPTPLPQGTAAAAWNVLNSAAVALDYVAVFAKNK